MMRIALLGLLLIGCTSDPPAPTAEKFHETASPKESPLAYRVLADESDPAANTVEYHVLIADQTKHDEVDKLLRFIYRHLMQRREPAPTGLTGYIYSNEVQYKTPPRSPIAEVLQKPGDIGPTFENRVPLEFWQQIDEALPHGDKGWKLSKKLDRDDAKKTLLITVPYTEPGKDQWADQLSFNVAMNEFTDLARALFEKVPELANLIFVGTWKDEKVVKISLDRPTYRSIHFADIDEQIGQLHGRTYLEASASRGSNAQLAKANASRVAGVYKKVLAQIKGRAWVSPKMK